MDYKDLIIMALILAIIYLYWKYQPNKSLSHNPDDIIERKGKQKEYFWDANDWEINSDNDNYHD